MNYFPNQLYGIYLLGKPILVLRDIELVRSVMVRDFAHFVDRNGSKISAYAITLEISYGITFRVFRIDT